MVAGVGLWAYTAGNLPFGPLSDSEQAVADDISADFEDVSWADGGARDCAAEGLVRDERMSGLEDAGIVNGSGDYDSEGWSADSGSDFLARLVDCTDDWPALAEDSSAPDALAPCLEDAGADKLGHLLAVDRFSLEEDDEASSTRSEITGCAKLPVRSAEKVNDGNEEAFVQIDPPSGLGVSTPSGYRVKVGEDTQDADLSDDVLTVSLPDNEGPYTASILPVYGEVEGTGTDVAELDPFGPPDKPTGKATAAYRSVKFAFSEPTGDGTDARLEIRQGKQGAWTQLDGRSTRVDTVAGGNRACLAVRAVSGDGDAAQYSKVSQVCGNAKAPTVRLVPTGSCTAFDQCTKYDVEVAGFRSNSTQRYVLRENGADITQCDAGACEYQPLYIDSDGRYTLTNAWNLGPNGRTMTIAITGTSITHTITTPGG